MRSPVSLKTYLSLHFALVAALPVITIACLAWFFVHPAIKNRTAIQHQAMARSIAGQISARLSGGQHQLSVLAGYLRDRQFKGANDLGTLLDAQCGGGELFEALFVVDRPGIVQAVGLARPHRAKRPDFIGLDLSGRNFMDLGKNRDTAAWSKTFLSTVSSHLAVAVSIPLKEGGLIGEITLENLSEFISDLPVESQFLILVSDSRGMIVADSRKRHWGQVLDPGLMTAVKPAGKPHTATKAFELEGRRMLGTLVGTDTAGWKILVAQSARKAFEPLWDIFTLIGLGLALATGLALVGGWLLAGKFAHVFTAYAQKAESIADGRYTLKWPKPRAREFSRLGQSLKRMAEKISRREKDLRDNEALLHNILESMDEGVLVLDREFKYRMVNKKVEKLGGVSRERLIGMRPWEAFPYIRGTAAEKRIKCAMAGDVPGSSEVEFHISPDKTVWARDSFTPLRAGDGKLMGVVGVIRDITRKKRDEQELRRLRNYLSNIIDSMPSILVAVDSQCRVTQWNNQTERTTGLSFEKALAQPLVKVFPGLAGEMDRIRTSVRERRVINAHKVQRKAGPENRFENVTIFPLVANGVDGAVIRVDDVTEQVRMEEMMIQSEKMLTVGGLAAGMAHEINNPLAAMMQTAQVMARRLGHRGDIPANREAAEAAGTTVDAVKIYMEHRGIPRMIEAISSSGARVADIVNNMLSFARKDDTGASFHHLDRLLDKTIELAATDYDLKKEYDFKRIRVIKEYADNLPAVPCQESKIQQVVLNILNNGAYAMQSSKTDNPRFILRTYRSPNGNMACIEIEDNGPGMDDATCKQIFDPFFTTKEKGKGTGLGLSVSYFIITENHKGEMAVESRPGAGAKFIIRLPVAG